MFCLLFKVKAVKEMVQFSWPKFDLFGVQKSLILQGVGWKCWQLVMDFQKQWWRTEVGGVYMATNFKQVSRSHLICSYYYECFGKQCQWLLSPLWLLLLWPLISIRNLIYFPQKGCWFNMRECCLLLALLKTQVDSATFAGMVWQLFFQLVNLRWEG